MFLNRGWKTVIGGFLIHLVLGTLYCWANITSAVTSYIRQYEPTLTYNDTILVYAAALAAQGCTMMIGGIISQRIGSRYCCVLGACVIISGTFLASFSSSYVQILFCQGILLGIGIGICYTAPITAAVKWMPNSKGLVTGVIVGGFGCGNFVFGFIATHVVNPNKESVDSSGKYANYFPPESDVVQRVPIMFFTLACSYILCMGLGCSLLSEPSAEEYDLILSPVSSASSSSHGHAVHKSPLHPRKSESKIETGYQSANLDDFEMLEEEKGKKFVELVDPKLALTENLSLEDRSKLHPHHQLDIPPGEVITNPLAWHIASCLIFTAVGGMYLAGTFKTYAQSSIKDEGFLAAISSTASLFNTFGRFFWGWLADRIGPLRTLQIMSLLFALTIFSYAHSIAFGAGGFALWTYLIFFFEGANFVLYVPVVVLLFGTKFSAANYGMIFSSYSAFVVLNISIMAGSKVTFETASLSMGLLTGIGFINLLFLEYHIRNAKKIPPSPEECKFR
jgi:MFS family permease